MVSSPSPGDSNLESPLEPAVIRSAIGLGSTAHLSTMLTIIRLDQRDMNRVRNKDIAREMTDMFREITHPSDIQRSIQRLETAGWIEVDRSGPRSKGNDVSPSAWGRYVVKQLGMDDLARRFDPDAELPDDAPRPPAEDSAADGDRR